MSIVHIAIIFVLKETLMREFLGFAVVNLMYPFL